MTIRSQLRAVLAKGRQTNAQLVAATGLTLKVVQQNMGALKAEGKIKSLIVENVAHYTIDAWPERATDAPPQQRKTPKTPRKGKPARKAKKAKPAAPASAAPVEAFTTALTFDNRLVLIERNLVPQIFTAEHTQDIATLLLDRFDPA